MRRVIDGCAPERLLCATWARSTLERMQPRVVSYEEAVMAVREQLAELLEGEEDWALALFNKKAVCWAQHAGAHAAARGELRGGGDGGARAAGGAAGGRGGLGRRGQGPRRHRPGLRSVLSHGTNNA